MDFQHCFSHHRSVKKLCDKSLKMKKLRCTKSLFFWGGRRGMWYFFARTLFRVSKLNNNTERFSDFKNLENLRTCFASFWVLEKSLKKIKSTKIYVLSSWSSWYTWILLRSPIKRINFSIESGPRCPTCISNNLV